MIPALLGKHRLVLGGGNCTPGTGSHPNASLELDWRSVGGLDDHHRELAASQPFPFDGHAGYGQDIPVGLHVSEREQESVSNSQPGTGSIVPGTQKNDARLSVAWKVIGEGANGLAGSV